ncbi:retrovirus-related pol polyprotein from transposon TNT 1-94 [Tanacetum coccineum]|uniref:Retrovirus-related pol polyprotein from transposon TNT 1-94 n=1 Tax=Tanacetum coccineum TaxID=301880 RepID=A0ABQ5C5Q2_9ASTR
MCMFALTVSTTEPKNIKEAMADHVWIEAMQEELHQFDRPKVGNLLTNHLEHNGFVDIDHPEKVYRLRKALYGLKQASRAWYYEILKFMISKGLSKGEMKFFLELQIHQSLRGIFINQFKYALKILKKHGMDKCDSFGTPMDTLPKLDADPSARPTEKQLKEVKRIFWYLKKTINIGDKLVIRCLRSNAIVMSTAEAEYVALSASCAQVLWMRTQLKDYGFDYNKILFYLRHPSAIGHLMQKP